MPEPQQSKEKGSTEVALCEIPIPMPHFLSGQEARLVGIIPYKPLSVQIGGGFSVRLQQINLKLK